MGRPLKKDNNGIDSIGDVDGATGIRIEFYDASLRTDGAIVKQRGAKTFVCTRDANVGAYSLKDSTSTTLCTLKNGAPNASGEMRMFGRVGSNSGAEVNIAKITKRIVTDFSGNRYTWALLDDSTNDYMILTAV